MTAIRLDNLPNELLFRILGFLNIGDLCRMRCINRRCCFLSDLCPVWQWTCVELCGSSVMLSSLGGRGNDIYAGRGWRSLYIVLKHGERCRTNLIPRSRAWQRVTLRPLIIIVLISLLPTAMAFDFIIFIKRRALPSGRRTGTLYRLCIGVAQAGLCLTSGPLLACYVVVTTVYAYCMQLPRDMNGKLEPCARSIPRIREESRDHIPTALFDYADRYISMTLSLATQADDLGRKALRLTSLRDELCLTLALLWDIGLWCLGIQDQKLVRSYR
jgi:hypothetical protein